MDIIENLYLANDTELKDKRRLEYQKLAFSKYKIIDYICEISSIEDYLLKSGLSNIRGTRHLMNDKTYEEITEIVIPNSVTSIRDHASYYCRSLTRIVFEGTISEWNLISKGDAWKPYSIKQIVCTDGVVNY